MSKAPEQYVKCLTKKCSNKAFSRGLCCGCKSEFLELKKAGKITEEVAIEAGAILACKTSTGRKKSTKWNDFLDELLKRPIRPSAQQQGPL